MEEETAIGAVVPCNVIEYEDSGKVFAEAVDPEELVSVTENSELDELASEVKERMNRVVKAQ